MAVDLTVIVTAHDETLVSGPTMFAADAAIAEAEAAGFSVQRVIALDKATPQTTAFFSQPRFDAWTRKAMACGDLGEVRNALVREVDGEAIAFLDADDLFSANWLAEGMRRLRAEDAAGRRVIVHPEINWLFDAAHSVFWKPDQDDPLFLPEYFYFMNYYDSLCLAPRAAHLAVPYVSRDIPRGLSFQDWQFAIESMAAGWIHVSARDTVIFKRRRDASLVTESRARKALVRPLAAMRVDRVSGLGGPAERQRPAVADRAAAAPQAGATPHYGPVFADRIAVARRARQSDKRARAVRDTAAYQAVAPLFDIPYYLACNADIAGFTGMDPVAHYLRAGFREGRTPSPLFCPQAYLEMYPDVAESGEPPFVHFALKGRQEGRASPPVPRFSTIAAALGLSPQAAEDLYAARYADLRRRLEHGALGAQVLRAAALEPLISLGWPEALQVKIPPFHSDAMAERLGVFLDLIDAAERRPVRFMICVNAARFGGALRLEGQVAQALAAGCAPEHILLVVTDTPGAIPAERVPAGVRQVDFAALVDSLKPGQRERVLAEFIRALAPDCVFNVNSRTLWHTLSTYGDALAHGTKLVGALFCAEQTLYGHWTGYPLKRVYRHFDHLHALVTDSRALADAVRAQYAIPSDLAARVVTLDAPVDPALGLVMPNVPRPARPQIFWSGRFDRQKRVDLVLDIAAAMPEADFHLWGEAVLDGAAPKPRSRNVQVHPPYARFRDLPLGDADLWLYTSGWDGVPQTLLEVGVSGLPLVSSDVGGTREAALPGLASLVAADADVATWVREVRAVLNDLPAARQRAARLRDQLRRTRTRDAYAAQVWALLDAPAETETPGTMVRAGA